ncbi:hypothetical protein KJ359_010883 [Pestalotiopsis sp. 9143b]|nr:hypothetical protein KJ359_010883 [Pestalotiopsis sp. 9143b]
MAPKDVDNSMAEPSAAQRKRERDKLNQRSKRRREREYIAALENRARCLEQDLRLATPTPPQASLGSFRPGQIHLEEAVSPEASDARPRDHTPVQLVSSDALNNLDHAVTASLAPVSDSEPLRAQSSQIHVGTETPMIAIAPDSLTKLLNSPAWMRLPVMSRSPLPPPRLLLQNDRFSSVIENLKSNPNIADTLPPTPKVLDLMFGGSHNELANLIVSVLASYPILPPERFAISWLIYVFFRWYIAPSEESFAAIPPHMRPTACQLCIEHPVYIAAIIWPRLRDKLILNLGKYALEDVFGLLSCTVRVRGSFNSSFISRENDGEPQLDDAFYRRFMQESGWGILGRFWTQHPELVDGLDHGILVPEEHLLSI